MDVNLRAVIADDRITTNGHRYTRAALEAMVTRINLVRVPVMPNMESDVSLTRALGILLQGELKDLGTHLEVEVGIYAKPHLRMFLHKCSVSGEKIAMVTKGTGILDGQDIGGDFQIEAVALCLQKDSATQYARILSVIPPVENEKSEL